MAKCNVCGRYFRLLAKNRYEVVELPIGLNCLTQGTERYNAFDCPYCGCQNVYGTKIKEKNKSISKQENIENFSDKLNAIYQTIAEYKSAGKNSMILNKALDPEIVAILIVCGYNVSDYNNGNTTETHIKW